MEKGHILRAIKNLEIASLLKVDRLPPNDMGKKHNMYYPKDTDRWDDVTDIELDDNMVSGLNISLIA